MSELGKYALPKGWSWATIPELIGKNGVFIDGDWVESKDQDPAGDVRLIQLADVGDGVFRDKSDRFMTKAKADELRCTFLKKGDVLIARMPDPLGRACIFPGDNKPSVTVVDIAIARSGNDEFDHRWLASFVNAHPFRAAISGLQAGSTRKRISRGNLATLPLPVPSRQEQRRIVAELEKQFTRLNVGIAALRRAQANLKRYRAAVLKAAIGAEGIPRVALMELAEPGTKILYGILQPGPEIPDGIPYVRPTEIYLDKIQLGEIRKTTREIAARYTRSALKTGDIILSIVGTIGKVATVPAELDGGNITQSSVRIRPNRKTVRGDYLAWVLRSPFATKQYDAARLGTAVPRLNVAHVRDLRIPLPTLAEQKLIAAEVERRLSVVDELDAVMTTNLQRANRLKQAVLEVAFAGKLATHPVLENVAPSRTEDAPVENEAPQKLLRPAEILPMKKSHGSINTLDQLLRLLDEHDGAATPGQLLAAAGLGDDVEKYFDLLREGQQKRLLRVPVGEPGNISRILK